MRDDRSYVACAILVMELDRRICSLLILTPGIGRKAIF